MTTNITPIEACEKIANMKGFKSYHATIYADGQLVPNTMPQLKMWTLDDAIEVATQALAPQEIQQKTFTLEEIKEIIKRLLDYSKKAGYREAYNIALNELLTEFEKENI